MRETKELSDLERQLLSRVAVLEAKVAALEARQRPTNAVSHPLVERSTAGPKVVDRIYPRFEGGTLHLNYPPNNGRS